MKQHLRKFGMYSRPFIWALKVSWHTSKPLFLLTNISTILTSSTSGIISTYLLAQATASVAVLASGGTSIKTPIIWTALYGAFTLGFDLVRRITNYLDLRLDTKLDIQIQNLYASKVSLFTQEQLDDSKVQSSLSMATREMYAIRRATNTVQSILSSLFAYIFAVVVVWQYAWGIGLLLSVLVPLLAISSAIQTKRRRQSWKDGDKDWRIRQGIFGYLTDPLKLFQLRIMGARDHLLSLHRLYYKKSIDYELAAEKKNLFIALAEDTISPLIEVGTRVWAIVLVAGARLSFDQFLFVIGLINQASTQTFTLGWNVSSAQETYLAASTMQELLAIPTPPDGRTKLIADGEAGGVSINFNNVQLVYPNGTPALSNITMNIPAGSKVAIVGENGAGKTTLLRLLTRQYDPTSGNVHIAGIPLADIKRDSLYTQLSILSQDYYLIDELTIKENLQLASPKKLSDTAISDALDIVGMQQKVSRIKNGLHARLHKSYDDGVDLSGGQRQRLAIARALLKPFELLILDEPTSAIDAKAERKIFNSIFQKSQNATVIIVSHRFATVRKADFIYVLDAGKIIEQGTHDELLAKNGHYAELYTIQAQDFA